MVGNTELFWDFGNNKHLFIAKGLADVLPTNAHHPPAHLFFMRNSYTTRVQIRPVLCSMIHGFASPVVCIYSHREELYIQITPEKDSDDCQLLRSCGSYICSLCLHQANVEAVPKRSFAKYLRATDLGASLYKDGGTNLNCLTWLDIIK